jgi:hypothetical protein
MGAGPPSRASGIPVSRRCIDTLRRRISSRVSSATRICSSAELGWLAAESGLNAVPVSPMDVRGAFGISRLKGTFSVTCAGDGDCRRKGFMDDGTISLSLGWDLYIFACTNG